MEKETLAELPDEASRPTYDEALMNINAGMLNQEDELANKISTAQKDTGKYLGETMEYFGDDKAVSNQVAQENDSPSRSRRRIQTHTQEPDRHKHERGRISTNNESPKLIKKMMTGHPNENLKECLDNDEILKTKNNKSNNSKEEDNAGGCSKVKKRQHLCELTHVTNPSAQENDQPLQIIETNEEDIALHETTSRTMNQTLEILNRI
ncbi:9659_t:CDS:2 [Acaulospora morrowiae]|uniref:9659_t:CDS:1 n=1 Tax=Acaulospora morrowiae TaxID=94023 RepID=A0A9N9BAQ2_9GLOM|nr:9659_t:CDS:2 [Acaulospora morrowiae]